MYFKMNLGFFLYICISDNKNSLLYISYLIKMLSPFLDISQGRKIKSCISSLLLLHAVNLSL